LQTDAEDFARLDVPDNVLRWPVVREGSVAATDLIVDVFVYEGKNSGMGEAVDWSNAARIADQGRMILAGGLAADNIASAIRTARPWGVDVSSGVESAPGKKDVKLIKQFIAAVRAAEND
jgi:phosphoribosylanthranilate isomerase